MAKDYAKENSSPRESRLAHPMLLGIIIGLLMGIIIALSVALWLNRLSNPFVDKGKAIEPLPKIGATQPPPPPEVAKAVEKSAEKAKPAEKGKTDAAVAAGGAAAKTPPKTDRPRFEFYQILPGEKEVTDKEVKAAKAAPPPPAGTPKPGSSPNSPKAFAGEIYWLQAGAFSSETEADNLKAKIALVGLEAAVRPVTVPDKGTLYRVRLGPYQSLESANRIKSALSQNGVGAAIIRTDEAKKE